jgi:putative component of membrane protein insertase Oxa1/YidC/SpoIIIJ protein YidD/outer membrane protein assembly factor BamD (BamD/ComL family)/TM2 domain-containing membrane protein YozV
LALFLFVSGIFLGSLPASAAAVADSTQELIATGYRRAAALPARAVIRLYQLFIAEQDLPTCNFQPFCSAFSMEAYGSTDPLQATLMTFDRLMRCNYWSFGEYPFVGGKLIDPAGEHLLWGRPRRQVRVARPVSTAEVHGPERAAAAADSGDLQAQLDFADAMARKDETEVAVTEYRYLAHQAPWSPVRSTALSHHGWLLFREARFREAAEAFEDLRAAAPAGPPAQAEAQVLAYLSRSMFEEQAVPRAHQTPLLRYVAAWGAIRAGRVPVARDSLHVLASCTDADVARASQRSLLLIDTLSVPRVRHAWVAGGLSALVPGLGRLYTGRYGDAVFSSAVTAGAAALAVRSARTGHWVNAGLFGSGATGFYLGNVYGSVASASAENRRAQQRLGAVLVVAGEGEHLLPQQLVAVRLAHCLPEADETERSPPSAAVISRWRANGDAHYQRAEWGEAARRYRLYVHWAARGTPVDDALLKMGQALRQADDDRGAQRSFEELLDRYPASPAAEQARLALARLHLRHGDNERARLELEEEVARGTGAGQVTEAEYLMAWVYLGQHQWTKAERWLGRPHRFDRAQEYSGASRCIAQSLQGHSGLPHRSPRLARLFSAAVPGAGQAYAGKPLDGAVSLAINSAIAYSLARSVRSEKWLDGALISGLLCYRFYVGSIYNAGRHAVAYNQAQDARLLERIRADVRCVGPQLDPLHTD